MLTDKFIAFLKAILLLSLLLLIIFFNTDWSDSSQKISNHKLIDEKDVQEEVEHLHRNKIIADTTQKYRQQVFEQKEKEYQQLNSQGNEYIGTLTVQQQQRQQELDKLKQRRLQAEQELKKIRQERKKLNKIHANSSTN